MSNEWWAENRQDRVEASSARLKLISEQIMKLKNTDKNILITGGLGFIGFHLCTQLRQHNPSARLTIVDNLSSTQIDPSLFTPLISPSEMTQGEIHITDLNEFDSTGQNFDEIYHLASPVGSLGILESNGYVAHSISSLAMKAADIASQSGAKLLYLSSSEVYGRDGQHTEDTELRVPSLRGTRMEYALGKLTAEHILINRSAQDGFTLRIVRPFNVIGAWQSAQIGFVIPTFFAAALNGTALPVFGDGSQKRSFCLVNDLVNGMMAVQQSGRDQAIYNLGNPDNIISIKELAHSIVQLCESDSKLTLTDPNTLYGESYLEAFQKMPDINKAIQHTGWKPKADLATALRQCKSFYSALSLGTPTNPKLVEV
ncbi:NAD-dependent epimerase/dehydratase family protein [Granulosicoccus sp.]|nr:NAD-dependent epimerase/dehydratase family protein [Granulosicoccus sp.]MDB4224245.1 NAD-dependent epimerase/dehydratase family protein [Granulosicoccus sp.]